MLMKYTTLLIVFTSLIFCFPFYACASEEDVVNYVLEFNAGLSDEIEDKERFIKLVKRARVVRESNEEVYYVENERVYIYAYYPNGNRRDINAVKDSIIGRAEFEIKRLKKAKQQQDKTGVGEPDLIIHRSLKNAGFKVGKIGISETNWNVKIIQIIKPTEALVLIQQERLILSGRDFSKNVDGDLLPFDRYIHVESTTTRDTNDGATETMFFVKEYDRDNINAIVKKKLED